MTRHWPAIIGVAVSLLGVAAYAQEAKPPAAPSSPAGDAQTGKKLYQADGCYECHGTAAQGSPRTGPSLLTTLPFAAFVKQLRRPASEMPPYEANVVSDQQAADIYAYVQT